MLLRLIANEFTVLVASLIDMIGMKLLHYFSPGHFFKTVYNTDSPSFIF